MEYPLYLLKNSADGLKFLYMQKIRFHCPENDSKMGASIPTAITSMTIKINKSTIAGANAARTALPVDICWVSLSPRITRTQPQIITPSQNKTFTGPVRPLPTNTAAKVCTGKKSRAGREARPVTHKTPTALPLPPDNSATRYSSPLYTNHFMYS
ncbi:MAG: hypothetical protein VR68_16410 [Peptococcaceae bacterium BRH_c4a]|nr:MAG: hypothetical protein VR68_16410 [Peptococcaceae bacterium BRH_c4a]